MTLVAIGDSPADAVDRLRDDLDRAKAHLRGRSAVVNDEKEQIYRPTAAVRQTWLDATGREAVSQARGLRVYHYGYGHSHPALDAKREAFSSTALRVGILPLPRLRRGYI